MLIEPPAHPLEPLKSAEIAHARELLVGAGLVGADTRFGTVLLCEPPKSDVLNHRFGDPIPRVVSAVLYDLGSDTTRRVAVELSSGRLLVNEVVDVDVAGRGPMLDEDFALADQILKSNAEWVAAIARRGITDIGKVRTVALSGGNFGHVDEIGRRIVRALAFYQDKLSDLPWAHPIDGVIAHVDLNERKVIRLEENGHVDVPRESGDYTDPAVRGPLRTDLKPIQISQPEGVSFVLEGNELRWQNWSLRVGFNGREGLTLHQIAYRDGDRERPIIYRASVSEMVVPYGEPSPMHNWQNYFDVGEYQFGRLANSLALGCDCVGEIRYLDATVADDHGVPRTIPQAICIHEEDYGILWKHNDSFNGSSETRRQRRLVISFFVTIGNYDYGFYWYLYLDGSIQLECKATGIVFTSGHDGASEAFASEIAPGVGAPYHQHLFSARLDMSVDGLDNCVDEVDAVGLPMGPTNPVGNAITYRSTRLRTESEGQRLADPSSGRTWRVSSASAVNRLGRPTAYVLYPEGMPTLLAAEGSSVRERAAFATKHLWVTRYQPDQLWAAGELVNQHPGGSGLPAYVAGDRDIDGQDIVVWHTFGLTHFPRTEDWPVMPVDYCGFMLKPNGFFDRNPTLDVPAPPSNCSTGHIHPGQDHSGRLDHGTLPGRDHHEAH